jgi:hypothetical protein
VQRADRGAADSSYYSAAFCGAVRRGGARFSVTVNMDPKVIAAIPTIPEQAWTPIRYPQAIWDDQIRCWVSDAQVAETQYTAFTSKKGQEMTARLIVRRVRDLNKKAAAGQDELFPAWRYHAVFTDPRSSWSKPKASTATARSWSRSSPTGPTGGWRTCHISGVFPANAAWLTCAAIAHNLCAPPGLWPASPTPRPVGPPSAAT